MAQCLPSSSDDTNGNGVVDHSPFLGSAPDHAMEFEMKDVLEVVAKDVTTQEFASKSQNGTNLPAHRKPQS